MSNKELFQPAIQPETLSLSGKPGEIVPLNALKLICACMVAAIHIPFFISPYLLPIYRVAVPVFFMISGYFLVDGGTSGSRWPRISVKADKIVRILKKIIGITLVASLAYYLLKVVVFKVYSFPIVETILEGGTISVHLWYLTAYIEALVVIWLLVKIKSTRLLLLLIPVGLAMNMVFGAYYWLFFDSVPSISFDGGVTRNPYFLNRNFLSVGIPCIALGALMRIYAPALKARLSVKALLFAVAGFLLAVYLETAFITRYSGVPLNGDIVLSTIPLSVAVFLLALYYRGHGRVIRAMGSLGKEHSTNIYLYHLLTKSILLPIAGILALGMPYTEYWVLPVTLIAVIPLSVCYNRLSKKISSKLSKKLSAADM